MASQSNGPAPTLTLDAESASEALSAACTAVDLDPTDASLIRLGENAVFRLRHAPVVARVSRNADRMPAAQREIRVSRWLARSDVPAIRALDVQQPVLAMNRVVTFWESASDDEAYGTTKELGAILRRLHALGTSSELELPPLAPIPKARHRIEHVPGLSEQERGFLLDRCNTLDRAYSRLTFTLPAGTIHGDANVGNLILDRTGRGLLADLDGFSVGPREWDLILTAMYYERYGWHDDTEYREFVRAYGFDVRDWTGYATMSDVRELLMVSWMSQNASNDPSVRDELTKRIHALQADSSRRDWSPF